MSPPFCTAGDGDKISGRWDAIVAAIHQTDFHARRIFFDGQMVDPFEQNSYHDIG
jgi:hypothetical protein